MAGSVGGEGRGTVATGDVATSREAALARIFITGSTAGLGLMTGQLLLDQGHEVTFHARSRARADELRSTEDQATEVLVGDLSTLAGMHAVADQANASGRFDAVVHNAGIGYREPSRVKTEDGLEHVFATNVLAPYVLTALMAVPDRLVYLSSGMHRGGDPALDDLQWERKRWNGAQAYSDSKLFDVVLAFAMARRWPSVTSNSVEPGWVPTKMGGPGAPDDIDKAHRTQVWLAVDPDTARTSGGHFRYQQPRQTHPAAASTEVQDALLAACAALSSSDLPQPD
jgi:NAD(P)-dependent dehydrogenase (short-subunit alcohol dehydrogenase family)